jgi:anthranilate phosphoribosyltransferase
MADIIQYIEPLLARQDLTFEQSTELLDIVFEGEVPEPQIAAFLTAMRIKGATPHEIAGLAKSLRTHAIKVNVNADHLVDTCGTGGAKIKTFNISTAAALVAAGAGVHVAKHGNRGITSKCGSADVLEALGVNLDPGPDRVAKCIEQARIGFMFAPKFHPAMKYVQPIRKALGFRTIFNILGPLANPAGASAQVMGVGDETLMEPIAEALKLLGLKHAIVVHSEGLDEISTMAPTKLLEMKDGNITASEMLASNYGLAPARLEQLKCGDAQTNAQSIKDILAARDTGPRRDIVLINAAAAIIAGNLALDFETALTMACDSITSGSAADCLAGLVELSNR